MLFHNLENGLIPLEELTTLSVESCVQQDKGIYGKSQISH